MTGTLTPKQAIELSLAQWKSLPALADHEHKTMAYHAIREQKGMRDAYDSGNDCFLCDSTLDRYGFVDCNICPLAYRWSDTDPEAMCEGEDTPYATWERTDETQPMIDLLTKALEELS